MYMETIPRSPRAQRVHPTACWKSTSITPQESAGLRAVLHFERAECDEHAIRPRMYLGRMLTLPVENESKKKRRKTEKEKKNERSEGKKKKNCNLNNEEHKSQAFSFAIHPSPLAENPTNPMYCIPATKNKCLVSGRCLLLVSPAFYFP